MLGANSSPLTTFFCRQLDPGKGEARNPGAPIDDPCDQVQGSAWGQEASFHLLLLSGSQPSNLLAFYCHY